MTHKTLHVKRNILVEETAVVDILAEHFEDLNAEEETKKSQKTWNTKNGHQIDVYKRQQELSVFQETPELI